MCYVQCTIIYGLNFPFSPADVTTAECVSSTAFDLDTGRRQAQWTQTSVWVVIDPATSSEQLTTAQSPLKSHTKKKTKVL